LEGKVIGRTANRRSYPKQKKKYEYEKKKDKASRAEPRNTRGKKERFKKNQKSGIRGEKEQTSLSDLRAPRRNNCCLKRKREKANFPIIKGLSNSIRPQHPRRALEGKKE